MDVRQHLEDRSLNTELYNCSWDDETASFLLFNLSGQVVGYQQYRPHAPKSFPNNPKLGRYYTYAKNKTAVWGLETFYFRNDVLFLTEGIFDACKLHNLGLPAIAVLSNDPKSLKSWLFALPRTVVAVCDNDAAGKKLAKLGQLVVVPPDGKDLGDMTNLQVKQLVERFLCE